MNLVIPGQLCYTSAQKGLSGKTGSTQTHWAALILKYFAGKAQVWLCRSFKQSNCWVLAVQV